MVAVNAMLFFIDHDPSADKTDKLEIDRRRARSSMAASAINTMPLRDRPHIVAFYGNFSADTLKASLSATFPFIIDQPVGGATVNVVERIAGPPDAQGNPTFREVVTPQQVSVLGGLIVFSRLPFPALNGGPALVLFNPNAGEQALIVVAVDDPVRASRYVFAGAAPMSFAQVQLAIAGASRNGADTNFPDRSVILGNFGGNAPPFVTGALGERFFDAFDTMRNPAALPPDPGFTFRDIQSGEVSRRDQLLVSRNTSAPRRIVAHQISTPIRHLSVGWSFSAHLQLATPFCTPSLALMLSGLVRSNPDAPGQVNSPGFAVRPVISEQDAYFWVLVDAPGTYSIFTSPDLEVTCFASDDLTNPMVAKGALAVGDLPTEVKPPVDLLRLETTGQTHSSQNVFYYRIRSRTPDAIVNSSEAYIVRHIGDSLATAIFIEPHRTFNPPLPEGQRLGSADACFLRISAPVCFDNQSYTETISVTRAGAPQDQYALQEVTPPSPQPIAGAMGLSGAATFNVFVTGPGERALRLIRSNVNATRVALLYRSKVRYLLLDESLSVFIDEETGVNAFGAEEFELKLKLDGRNLGTWTWSDADHHESWPGLVSAVRASANAALGRQVRSLPFATSVSAEYAKTDSIDVDRHVWTFVGPADAEPDAVQQLRRYSATHIQESGRSSFRLTLSKFPQSPI